MSQPAQCQQMIWPTTHRHATMKQTCQAKCRSRHSVNKWFDQLLINMLEWSKHARQNVSRHSRHSRHSVNKWSDQLSHRHATLKQTCQAKCHSRHSVNNLRISCSTPHKHKQSTHLRQAMPGAASATLPLCARSNGTKHKETHSKVTHEPRPNDCEPQYTRIGYCNGTKRKDIRIKVIHDEPRPNDCELCGYTHVFVVARSKGQLCRRRLVKRAAQQFELSYTGISYFIAWMMRHGIRIRSHIVCTCCVIQ
jgi:gas vesicle protein